MYSVNICLVVCMPLVWLPLASRLLASCCPWFWKANSCCSPWVSGAEAENRAQGEVSGEKSNEPAFHWALVTSSFCHHLKSKLDISLFPRCLHLASLLSWKHGGDTCPQSAYMVAVSTVTKNHYLKMFCKSRGAFLLSAFGQQTGKIHWCPSGDFIHICYLRT